MSEMDRVDHALCDWLNLRTRPWDGREADRRDAFRAGWAAAMERAAGMVEDAGPLLYDRHRATLAAAIRSAGR